MAKEKAAGGYTFVCLGDTFKFYMDMLASSSSVMGGSSSSGGAGGSTGGAKRLAAAASGGKENWRAVAAACTAAVEALQRAQVLWAQLAWGARG